VVDLCAGRQPAVKASGSKAADVAVNLLRGGGFERGRGGHPDGWEAPPKGEGVVWQRGARRCIRFDVSKPVAETTGVIYYSDPIPVEPGAYYRVEMDIQTDGPQVIVWAKGYAQVGQPRDGKPREVETYRHQKRHYPEGPRGGWEHYRTAPFRPKHPRFAIKTMRVMLYAYLRPGTVRFDNVTVKKAGVAAESASDRAMLRAFGEKGKQRAGADRDLVGGTAQTTPREIDSKDREGASQ
jgi:hypothetical protein